MQEQEVVMGQVSSKKGGQDDTGYLVPGATYSVAKKCWNAVLSWKWDIQSYVTVFAGAPIGKYRPFYTSLA